MPQDDGPPWTDKHGNHLSAYPDPTDYGRLLGFNFAGNAVYATAETVTLATLDAAGDLRVPPRERWLAGEFPLGELGLSPGDYVLYAADEGGPWRVLTDFARTVVADRGVDAARVVRETAAEGDPESLVDALTADDSGRAVTASEDLRRLVVDRPEDVLEHCAALLDVLRERLHGEGEADVDSASCGADTAAPGDPTQGLLLRNVAFAVARVVRASPDAGLESVDRLLACFDEGRDRERDAEAADSRELLLDALDVLGRRRTDALGEALVDRLAGDDGPKSGSRVRLLTALYHLEQRYATSDHPLLEDEDLREAIAALTDTPETPVRDAAEAVETVHGFHRS